MAYVAGFQNDILISYASLDNTEGWEDAFERALDQHLSMRLGAQIRIWRDEEPGGGDQLGGDILEQIIKSSAVFLPIISRNNLHSARLLTELQVFEQAAALPHRVFNVIKTPLPDKGDRQILGGRLGYEFYKLSEDTRMPWELDPTSRDFLLRVDEVAYDIGRVLSEMRASPPVRANSPVAKANRNSQRVFFSYAREDSEFALRLAQDLKSRGAPVWLDQLDIKPGRRWDREVSSALRDCPSMLVVLSPDSVNSDNVMDEVSFALEERKTLIPILRSECQIPFRLRRVQFIDFRKDYEVALKDLLAALSDVR